jgi:hypothetical protein
VLNKKLKAAATIAGDEALQSLCLSCQNAAIDLLEALEKVRVRGKQQKWESIRKALRSVWSKEENKELEQRLAKLKEDLNLHLVVGLKYVISSQSVGHADNIWTIESKSPISSRSI